MSAVLRAKTKTKKSTWLYIGTSNEELCMGVTIQMSYLADFGGYRLLCNEPEAAMETLW